MLKTKNLIEDDFLLRMRAGAIADVVRGGIYAWGQRPYDSKAEDIVISVEGLTFEQIQTGYLNVGIYIPEAVAGKGRTVYDRNRAKELQNAVMAFGWSDLEYRCEFSASAVSYNDALRQHHILITIHFQRLSSI